MGVIGGFGSVGAASGPEMAPEAASLHAQLGAIAHNAKPSWLSGVDTDAGLKSLVTKVLADGKVTAREVRELVTEAFDYGSMTASERTVLRELLSTHGSAFEPAAREALARFLGVRNPIPTTVDASLFAALRPQPASPTTRDDLASIDAGFDFWRHTEAEGGTARAATAVKSVERFLSTSLTDWTVSDADKQSAAKALEGLSPKEFLWALNQLWSEFRADGTSEAARTRSAFLFEPKQRAMTDGKLDDLESYFRSTIQDAKAREVVLDYLTTMRTQAWPK